MLVDLYEHVDFSVERKWGVSDISAFKLLCVENAKLIVVDCNCVKPLLLSLERSRDADALLMTRSVMTNQKVISINYDYRRH
jgi:hypothetical protein